MRKAFLEKAVVEFVYKLREDLPLKRVSRSLKYIQFLSNATTPYACLPTYIYISREISIEHHSVGLASLAQLYLYNPIVLVTAVV